MKVELDILVIGAHPDDAEIGCGGTIAHYKKRGKKVGVLDLSNGEPTPFGTVEKRMAEVKAASEILNLDLRITLDIRERAGYLGYQIGVKYAEGFITTKHLVLDFENLKL
ncbi:MAG: PIG-L family deacetylase [Candidatus Lokiarchaeota archaeon]|nr:PIG-L family deacetylase [Candidatus Lokiarchaeota archaeon]